MTQCLQKDPSKLNQTFIWPREPVVHSKILGIQVWSLFFVCFFSFSHLWNVFILNRVLGVVSKPSNHKLRERKKKAD